MRYRRGSQLVICCMELVLAALHTSGSSGRSTDTYKGPVGTAFHKAVQHSSPVKQPVR